MGVATSPESAEATLSRRICGKPAAATPSLAPRESEGRGATGSALLGRDRASGRASPRLLRSLPWLLVSIFGNDLGCKGAISVTAPTLFVSLLLLSLIPVSLMQLRLQLLVHLLWKHRLNRRYYALREQMKEQKSGKDTIAPEAAPPAARGRCNLFLSAILPTKDRRPIDPAKKIKFYPFPGILRWPTLPCFVCVCCLSGLLQSAVTILAAHKTAPRHALVFAFAAVGIAVGVLLLLWTQLVLFARRHLRHMWVPERAPDAPKEVADPALRLVSTVRRRLLTSMAITATKVHQLKASLTLTLC